MLSIKSPPEIDVDRLRGVLEFLTAHPKLITHAFWGIKMLVQEFPPKYEACYSPAGWAVALSLWHRPLWTRDSKRHGVSYAEFTEVIATRTVRHIRPVARELLGFTREQDNLFASPTNSLYTLWGYASLWTDGAIQRPEHVTAAGLRH